MMVDEHTFHLLLHYTYHPHKDLKRKKRRTKLDEVTRREEISYLEAK